jgi:hypothetical protein
MSREQSKQLVSTIQQSCGYRVRHGRSAGNDTVTIVGHLASNHSESQKPVDQLRVSVHPGNVGVLRYRNCSGV